MDHPDITRAIATGYARPEPPHQWVARVTIWFEEDCDTHEVEARIRGELIDIYPRVRVDDLELE